MIAEGATSVFIVDDSPVVRERLTTLFSELPNVEVVGQADIAFEAIECIRKLRPSVVVLDISMPGGSGMQVLEVIKRDRPGPMVIMLTNFAHDHYRQKCLELGADYFFDKSTEFERVTDVLRQLPRPGKPDTEGPRLDPARAHAQSGVGKAALGNQEPERLP